MQICQEQYVDEYNTNPVDDDLELEAPETPEDVAVLYTWANVHGGKYRDFSASRREFRAQQRHRMVEQQREAELDAARAREEAAAQEMEEVRRLEEHARHDADLRAQAEQARRRAEENVEQERLAAQRHVEIAEELKRALDEAQQEMEEARRRAEEQASRYAEADARYRASARQEIIPGEIDDPYYYAGPLEATAFAPGKGVRSSVPQRVSSERRILESYYRNKGNSDAMPARSDAMTEGEGYGLFSSGQRSRGSSANRPAYTEVSPAARRDRAPFAEARPETPEDTRERTRADELQRLAGQIREHADRERDADAYYDGEPVGQERSSDPASRNSAPSNVYLAPRVQQAPAPVTRPREDVRSREEARPREEMRPREESGPRSAESSQDPTPGNTHTLEHSRARRRESAADVQARTVRRPRESAMVPKFLDGRDEIRTAPRTRDDAARRQPQQGYESVESSIQRSVPDAPGDAHATFRSASPRAEQGDARADRQPPREAVPERSRERDGRPEWLLRESLGSYDDALPQKEERVPLRESGRDAREQFREEGRPVARRDDRRPRGESQMIPAADGGFNLPPLPDRAAPVDRMPPMEDRPARMERAAVPEQRLADAPKQARPTYRDDAPLRTEQRPTSPTVEERVPARNDVAARALPAEEVLPARPVAERRRTERNSGERITREMRVPQIPSVQTDAQPRERRQPQDGETGARPTASHPADTLQQSRERVAARWFALKGLMGSSGDSSAEVPVAARVREMAVPILAVASLSGGVGKTSLVATVGRALSSVGERVLLADATPHGLLPYYFGARELRPDVVRTFSPPPGSKDAPVFMVNYEADRLNGDEAGQTALLEEIARNVKGTGRLLLDLNATGAWLARRLAGMNTTILVPVAADMNSVLGIKNVERFFAGLQDADGQPQQPYYILNQFDASLPLHLDVREVLRQQLGDRLLPVMIRRSPSVSEALAEGMTVMDYAPESPVTEDYTQLAEWVRRRSAPAQTALRSTRWSER